MIVARNAELHDGEWSGLPSGMYRCTVASMVDCI